MKLMKLLGIIIVMATVLVTLFSPSATHATTRARTPAETVLNDSPVRLSAGALHACQVNDDGTVRCWGRNNAGQLGDGTTTDRPTPVTVFGLTNAVAIAAGTDHACALIANGSVRCWGDNTFGQLGDGTTTDRLTPVAASGITNAVTITAGHVYACALLANGGAHCWGRNRNGQLGDGTTTNRLAPVPVSDLTNAVAIAAGIEHTCALLAVSTVTCWGDNGSGELGDGTRSRRLTPTPVFSVTNAVAIAAGGAHTCALVADGTARCWGNNTFGQLGDGTTTQRLIPVLVSGLTNPVAIAAGSIHTCALLGNGGARCWGANRFGQLGDGTTAQRLTPVLVSGLTSAVAIAAGSNHTCALVADGTARCWGDNSNGQLGNGTTSDSFTPTTVAGGGGSVTGRDIAAGSSHTCAVRANSTVSCWGSNSNGQIGDGTTIDRLTPVAVSGLTDAVAIAAGDNHTCALLGNGSARCWGRNDRGQLGDGTTTTRLTPVSVSFVALALRPTSVVAIAAGSAHTCALLADGSARCWGDNSKGQLGDGTTTDRLTPVGGVGLFSTVAIAAGSNHTCALHDAGQTVSCWGDNSKGQLGDGTTTNRLAPVRVSGFIINLVAIAAGDFHTCALLADGTARCWGANGFGQLGDGTTTQHAIPITVIGLTNAVAIAAGAVHSCALVADGTARCWGDNTRGQLGDGTTTQRLTPTTVTIQFLRRTRSGGFITTAPLTNIVQVATGGSHTCAIIANGSLRCWGANTSGQLGINSTSDQLRPVSVPSFTLNIDPLVRLRDNSRVTTVQIIATCETGQRLHVEVTLTQGEVSGRGVGSGKCTGGIERYPVTVPAQGPEPFLAGPAQVEAEALIREDGLVVDTQEWTRKVQLVIAPD